MEEKECKKGKKEVVETHWGRKSEWMRVRKRWKDSRKERVKKKHTHTRMRRL